MQHGDLLKMGSEENGGDRKRRSHGRGVGEELRTCVGCRKYMRSCVDDALLRAGLVKALNKW